MEYSLPGLEPAKVHVSVDEPEAIEWAIDKRMRLVEIRLTPTGHVAVMERFEDAHDPDGFPLILGHRINGNEIYLR